MLHLPCLQTVYKTATKKEKKGHNVRKTNKHTFKQSQRHQNKETHKLKDNEINRHTEMQKIGTGQL